MNEINTYKPFTLIGFLLLFLFTGTGYGIEGTEYQIKGAMMINFIKFVEWPEQLTDTADASITIGIVGKDNFGSTLDQIEGRTIGGKQLSIRHINSLNQLSGCQVVYVGADESNRSYQVLREISEMPVLTIGEEDDFIRLGGIIRFYTEKNHIRFEINQTAAQKSSLKLSVKLLEVAAAVH